MRALRIMCRDTTDCPGQALAVRRPDVVLPGDLEHRRAGVPRDDGDREAGQGDGRQHPVLRTFQPPVGNQPNCTEKKTMSRMDSTKLGVAMPTMEMLVAR
jgi:hypothetical protein